MPSLSAQKGFSLSAGANGGIINLDELITQQNYNVNLAMGLLEDKFRAGLRYSRFLVETNLESFDFTLGGIFVQGGFYLTGWLRPYLEASFHKGDYGHEKDLYPREERNTSYLAISGGLEARIFPHIHLVVRLQSMRSVTDKDAVPENYGHHIPSVNIGVQFTLSREANVNALF